MELILIDPIGNANANPNEYNQNSMNTGEGLQCIELNYQMCKIHISKSVSTMTVYASSLVSIITV